MIKLYYNRFMRTLFLCGREIDYPRNQILLRAIKEFSQIDLIAERGKKVSILLRSIRILIRAIPKLILTKYDLIFVGFYGYLLIPFTRLAKRTPVIFDAFVSNFDTLIIDRKLSDKNSMLAKLSLFLDRIGCRISDIVLVDTYANARFFANTIIVPVEKIKIIPVGAVDTIFYPVTSSAINHCIHVLYYCTYHPVHGAPLVVEAAKKIRDKSIQFVLVGTGPEFRWVEGFVRSNKLTNVILLPDLPLDEISNQLALADICLGGHFGNSGKAERTIPGKIYQILASGKPVIAVDTEANRELLIHKENAYLCSPGDPQSLAEAISILSEDERLRKKIGANGRKLYLEKCSEIVIGNKLKSIVEQLLSKQVG